MTDLIKPLAKSLKLVGTHEQAGHLEPDHPKFPKAVIDVGSLITNARRWHDQYVQPATEREQLSYLVRNAVTHKELAEAMSAVGDQIQAAADATGAAANAAAGRVIDLINADRTVIADLQAKSDADDAAIAALQAQIDAGTVTPEAAQAVLDSLTATNAKLADLDSDPLTPV